MTALRLVLGLGALSLCIPAVAQNPAPARPAATPRSDAQIAFGTLKSLAGTWSGAVTTDPPNAEIDGPIQVALRVASRGSVLVHEMAPAGIPEPTMIYTEGDRLTLIHYCDAGNRPRLRARQSPDRETVEFDFVDISGSTTPLYLYHFVFTILSPDHHTEDWTFRMPGDKQLHAHFDLQRAKDSVPRAGK